MSDPLVKALLDAMTPEQKQELVNGLLQGHGRQPLERGDTAKITVSADLEREEVLELPKPKPKPRVVVNEDFTVTRNDDDSPNRKAPVRAKKNQWVDTGEDARDEETQLTSEQIAQMEKTKTARNRQAPKQKTVECHICGKSFKINPSLVYGENIRCNRCVGR